MKLKKVAALCDRMGMFYLCDQVNGAGTFIRQWLGDGCAAYPIDGLPYLDPENLCAMFDISEKRKEKLIFRHKDAPASINWDDADPVERQVDDPKLCLRYEGQTLLPLQTSAGIVFIQDKYLAPLDSLDYMHLYERRSGDSGMYIIAKIGMVVQAVIMPIDVVSADLIDHMEKLTDLCRTALIKKEQMYTPKERAELEENQGTLFQKGAGE
ncbi:MAG: hypothetical protein HDT35_01115 [Clostridiales bacterium]|nr:hypothetical protein [Clostridiales bacterium]